MSVEKELLQPKEAELVKTDSEKGCIFDIQRFSIQDGPGIRTTVFFKGCPLSCWWCSNVESQYLFPEVAIQNSLCNKCGNCLKTCKNKAITIVDAGIKIDRKLCTNCANCIPVCLPEALKVYGFEVPVEEVINEVKRDEPYYRNSGGGVTASGGEPLSQIDFLVGLFRSCQMNGLHTTLDTSGYAKIGSLIKALEYTNLVLYDLKHMDSAAHRKFTGVPNELILENARLVVSRAVPIIFRIPLIPGYNDSDENIRACAEFASELGVNEIDLLPYHRFGANKYRMLGLRYKLGKLPSAVREQLERPKQIIEGTGLACTIGG